jgi:hypothetical protein
VRTCTRAPSVAAAATTSSAYAGLGPASRRCTTATLCRPFFKLTFFFRVYPPGLKQLDWRVMPSITLHKGNMEMSGLEKQYPQLDREIYLIKSPEIINMVKNLIITYGGVA